MHQFKIFLQADAKIILHPIGIGPKKRIGDGSSAKSKKILEVVLCM